MRMKGRKYRLAQNANNKYGTYARFAAFAKGAGIAGWEALDTFRLALGRAVTRKGEDFLLVCMAFTFPLHEAGISIGPYHLVVRFQVGLDDQSGGGYLR